MKVQGTSVPAAQSQQTQQTQQSAQPQAAQAAQAAPQRDAVALGGKDEFVKLPPNRGGIDLGGVLGPKNPVSLTWGDRVTASGLSNSLSSPVNDLRLAFGKKSETVTRDAGGTYRGPEGQPLVQVKLKDGNTAYVDPNTNKYYLTNEKPDFFGRVHTLPASDLPKGSQFSNSYFSDADVKQLGDCARSGSPFGTIKWPVPHPIPFPHGPVELPRGPMNWLDAAGTSGGIKG